jgi:hypothetical protein
VFIAMNNFSVAEGKGEEFERIWKTRDTHLQDVPGIVRFALLRGDAPGEYISHSRPARGETLRIGAGGGVPPAGVSVSRSGRCRGNDAEAAKLYLSLGIRGGLVHERIRDRASFARMPGASISRGERP